MSAHRQDNLRFMVDSHRDQGAQYAVELGLYDHNGACTCPHFKFRLEPYLKTGIRPPDDRLRCAHILEARKWLLDDIINQAVQQAFQKSNQQHDQSEEGETLENLRRIALQDQRANEGWKDLELK